MVSKQEVLQVASAHKVNPIIIEKDYFPYGDQKDFSYHTHSYSYEEADNKERCHIYNANRT